MRRWIFKLCLVRYLQQSGILSQIKEIYFPGGLPISKQRDQIMASQDRGSPLRRSTRQKKEISYKDIERFDEIPGSPDSPDDDFDQTPLNQKRGPKPKPFEPTPRRISTDIRANSINSTSREGRIYAIAGSDENVQRQIFDKMEKWGNIYDDVPAELLDYSVGWGICTGDWNGKAGDRQNTNTVLYSLIESLV